jgi:hypothetical protein
VSNLFYRIRKLYRPVIGWRWWLQFGAWYESSGSVFTATGRGRRTFIVDFEEGYDTKAEAEAAKAQRVEGVR